MQPRLSRAAVVAIVAVAALLAAEVARLTVANALAEARPGLANVLAPRVPAVLVSKSMTEVGRAAASGRTPPQSATQRLRQLTAVAPLSAEPFLVQAAIAQRQYDFDRAEKLLLQARWRDPRSAAARYLLADTWVRQGRISDGLGEMGILTRLLPGTAAQLAPLLAQYASTPGAPDQLKRMLAANPQLKEPLLNALAADPGNVRLILELDAAAASKQGARAPAWQTRLLNGLIDQGAYERAYALWQRLSGVRGARPLLFNGNFTHGSAPPPFNWSLASGRGGLAEPANGQLRVLHYGREDTTLASQQLLLGPGSYRLSAPTSGSAAPGALAWVVICLPGGKSPLVNLPLSSGTAAQASFEVPSGGCPAQKLALNGRAQDMPQESDLLVGPVSLERAGR